MTADSKKSSTSAANEFVKGLVWGFVAFVHVFLIAVVTYKLSLNCLPAAIAEKMKCADPSSASCATTCATSDDLLFFILAGVAALAFVLLPLGFAIFWLAKHREERSA